MFAATVQGYCALWRDDMSVGRTAEPQRGGTQAIVLKHKKGGSAPFRLDRFKSRSLAFRISDQHPGITVTGSGTPRPPLGLVVLALVADLISTLIHRVVAVLEHDI